MEQTAKDPIVTFSIRLNGSTIKVQLKSDPHKNWRKNWKKRNAKAKNQLNQAQQSII